MKLLRYHLLDDGSCADDVKKGFIKSDDYFFEPDREKAIKLAINMAEKNDIILITGKGHETYQEVENGKKLYFDDKEIVRKIAEEMPDKNI